MNSPTHYVTKLALPLLLAAVCSAQEAQIHTGLPAAKPQPPIVTMSFNGGTLASFVAAVRAAEPKCNIVVAAEAASAQVPAMELKRAGLDQVLESACAVATSKMRINCSQSRGNGEPVFAIVARAANQQLAAMIPPNQDTVGTIVLSLNRLTEGDKYHGVPGLEVDTILSAIETGTSYNDQPKPVLRYHKDSGLLFLRGSKRQLSLANDVLQILERDHKDRVKNASMNKRAKQAGDSSKQGR